MAVALTILLSGSLRNDIFGGGGHPIAARQFSNSTPLAHAPSATSPRALSGATAGPAAGAATQAPSPLTLFGANHRLVARGSTLVLATPPAQISALAGAIVSATERLGGVVEHSNVNAQGSSSYASFTLTLPSARLGRLIAKLSGLASVRALHQSTQDITSPYENESSLLARRQAQLRSLQARLAVAPTATAAASLRRQIGSVEHRIAIERETIARLGRQAAQATLTVQVVAGAARKHHAAALGALTRGYRDALHALQEILAIALIVLAIVLPFAICALALWWAAASVRHRSRERAIRSA